MLLQVLYRVRVSPIEHLGCRSLRRLEAFQTGYTLFPFTRTKDYDCESTLREWVIRQYQPSFATGAKGAVWILSEIAQDDEAAFELFFQALDLALISYPSAWSSFFPREIPAGFQPIPLSGFLNVLTSRPLSLLRTLSVGNLRAFLDGYRLAALEEGHLECLDLEDFEHWVRRQLELKGMFRWENAISADCQGQEPKAYEWAIRELKAFRATQGPLSDRNYEFIAIP